MMRRRTLALALAAAALAGCTDTEQGNGTLEVEIWGEDFIEQGIPDDVFVDGWSVTFERFLVAVDGIAVARGESTPDISDEVQRIFDLVRPGPAPFLTREVPAGRYDDTSYTVEPAGSDAAAGNAAAADVELMADRALSVYVEGSATDGTETKTFAWGFDTATSYTGCHSTAEIANGEAGTVQITIHADHLFYDDLFSTEPDVTFTVLAEADADDDGELTLDELAAYDITTLPNYGVGSEDVEDLAAFVAHLTRTLGHIDGEGHCEAAAASH